MTATFLAYSVASRAMEASQASINITGNNIANINTEGYTRQRVDINAITISGQTQKYATPQISTGIGAKAVRTTQMRDPYIDARYRTQNAETNRYDTMVSGLTNLEDVFDEAETEALQGELSSFINDLQSLSQTPTSSDIAQVTRSAAQKVTQVINMYSTQLEEVRVEQTENLKININSQFNTDVKNIASLNEQIQREEIFGNTPNELYDQRNLLIDKLSGVANINVSYTPEDVISDNLSIPHIRITMGNISIVDNEKYAELRLDSETDPLNVKLSITDTKGVVDSDVNSEITDGSIKGYLNLINGKGSFANISAGESDSKGIYYYTKSMDIFANKLATVLNSLNDTATGDPTVAPLFTDSSGTSTIGITAKNIQVSSAWLNNPSFIKTTSSTTTTGGADNVLRMISAMSDEQKFKVTDSSGTESTLFEGTFNEYMTGLLGDLSTDVELNTNFSDTATNVLETIANTRDSSSGVSLNEEGINLSAYQKVYNAAIRYFNILDENLNTIINTMGV